MNTLFIYIIFFLGHVAVYFYYRNSFINTTDASKNTKTKNSHLSVTDAKNSIKKANSIVDNKQMLLQKNLKQLEFISEFEMYLEEKTLKNFSIEFLQEFEQIKIEAQLSTLKTTNQLNNSVKLAA
ncbi:hypothetical protein H8K90_03250 [Winogradskyella echinorum]|uniref:Uncharacterized protein n=1 Tax=Winogradskyella echinorum TaxID=538189 RepID=A0ABR6XY24_9FLAO|nr:hypothetical protein [Winogradskyella echinorum]MBC3845386.1 hypothetical protein [Winogradskyella echinorum]MBC5749734.1 hypothetical protein [Winogradskyella echinorum]